MLGTLAFRTFVFVWVDFLIIIVYCPYRLTSEAPPSTTSVVPVT